MRLKKRFNKRAFRLKLKRNTVFSIAQIVFLSLAGIVIISFSRRGSVLIALNDLLLTYFSWSTVFLPFIFIAFAFLISKLKGPLSQPNVLIGALLFFVSVASLFRTGILGKAAWESIVGLITGPGAFIIFAGTLLIGLIVLFNTSFDQIFREATLFYARFRRLFWAKPKSYLKVSGEEKVVRPEKPVAKEESGILAQKLLTNVPGEEKVWRYPSLGLLGETQTGKADRGDIKGNAAQIEKTLESFGITARVVEVNLGPAVTQYALEVALGTKLSKITALERDLALALAAPTGTIRIEAPIPGKSLVGIELPNRAPEFVPLRKMLESEAMKTNISKLAVALGLDVSGKPIVTEIGRMPHVLIAGQTGSGKSVCINAFLSSMLFRVTPGEVKFILVDPKRVELTLYNGIPHLLTPVIVDPEKVISALRWLLAEMDRRYKLFAQAGARNIDRYNEMSGFQALPYIVLVIDELADIILFSPVEVEDAITRIAQMSRATGIHMVLATQRPSVDVITGLIKANIPCRIAFAVSSQVDSRVILDLPGAEKLLGRGDMLYLPPEQAKPIRIQGAYVSEKETGTLTSFLKGQGVGPQYTEEVTTMSKSGLPQPAGVSGEIDDLFREAVKLVCQYNRASASLLQRRLSIGYARAARIIDQLEANGVVGVAEDSKPREVLIRNAEEFLTKTAP